MSRNEKRIRDALAAKGIKVKSLTWTPIGQMMEMCGREGGWILNDFNPIGLSTNAAIKLISESWFTAEKYGWHG